jgi:hypothetical protein
MKKQRTEPTATVERTCTKVFDESSLGDTVFISGLERQPNCGSIKV